MRCSASDALVLAFVLASTTVARADVSDRQLCTEQWHTHDKPAKAETRRCIDYWVTVAYGAGAEVSDLDFDPVAGRAWVLKQLSAKDLEKMAAHVWADCGGYETCDWPARRAHEVLEKEAAIRFSLFDEGSMTSLEPVFQRALDGKPVGDARGIEPYGLAAVWRLKNAVFARHGRSFNNPDLERFFYGQTPASAKWKRLPLKKDTGYSDAKLTAVDKANIQLLSALEKKLEQGDAGPPERAVPLKAGD